METRDECAGGSRRRYALGPMLALWPRGGGLRPKPNTHDESSDLPDIIVQGGGLSAGAGTGTGTGGHGDGRDRDRHRRQDRAAGPAPAAGTALRHRRDRRGRAAGRAPRAPRPAVVAAPCR